MDKKDRFHFGGGDRGYQGYGGPPSEEEVKKILEKIKKMPPLTGKPLSNSEKEQK